MTQLVFSKKKLLEALKDAGLPYTTPNFILKYERLICAEHGKPLLVSPRDKNGDRAYTIEQIREIIRAASAGWLKKHWHWEPHTEE